MLPELLEHTVLFLLDVDHDVQFIKNVFYFSQ